MTVTRLADALRPKRFEDIVGQDHLFGERGVIRRLMAAGKIPNMIFFGPPGTGKTTTIMACAKMLYGTTHSNMVLEVRGGGAHERKLNASDDRGIDVVRDQIRNFAGTQKLFSNGIKLVVLDEADNMTNAAQFALRRSRHTEDD